MTTKWITPEWKKSLQASLNQIMTSAHAGKEALVAKIATLKKAARALSHPDNTPA